MSEDIWNRDEPESPCVRICVVHPEARLCVGCFRSLEEIARWGRMSAAERRAVVAELPGRADRMPVRRGGSRGRR